VIPSSEILAVNSLLSQVVLPERASEAPYRDPTGVYTLRWVDYRKQVIFVAVAATSTISFAGYAESLLRSVRESWISKYAALAKEAGKGLVQTGWALDSDEFVGWSALAASEGGVFSSFEDEYELLLDSAMRKYEERSTRRVFSPSENSERGDGPGNPALKKQSLSNVSSPCPSERSDAKAKSGVGGKVGSAASPGSKKSGTQWNNFKYSKEAADSLDRSKKRQDEGGESLSSDADGLSSKLPVLRFDGKSLSGKNLAEDSDKILIPSAPNSWWGRSTASMSNWLSSATGSHILSKEDLDPVCTELKGVLVGKNVSEEVADKLTAAIGTQLAGKTLSGGLTLSPAARLQAAVGEALRDAIERVLSPTDPVDLLHDVRFLAEVQRGLPSGKKEPYVAVLCGVNGVGKSTTLAKLAFHLKDNGLRVMIAACDSFRAGAVEQLKKHCANLDVELYAQGYQKDPVEIARAAIRKAKEGDLDVVLVDTAGRMQNNSVLMSQLAKLVSTNKPHMVLFVGEALVGGDGVDQLREFNKALVDHAVDSVAPRGIDGIVLTKFDTVDDKVGAALSMVHASNIPVAFLGTGQQYQDLRKLNVGAVLRALLS